MGAWNVSITGDDTAQDLKKEYQSVFCRNGSYFLGITHITMVYIYFSSWYNKAKKEYLL